MKINRIVIKLGSSLFYSKQLFNRRAFLSLTQQVCDLVKDGKEIIIVSSGAIALGMHLLKLKERPKELNILQAAAAIGQNELMNVYSRYFKDKTITAGQILLTWDDFDDHKRYLNAKNTILTLLKYKCVPIINENDTVSVDEIKFGDNDRLSAMVATLSGADLLLILSDVEGLLDRDKKLVRLVREITPQIRALACPTQKNSCVGGMITKIEAAKIAVNSGIPCVIACGHGKNIINKVIAQPQDNGTLFIPKKSLKARSRWLAYGSKPKGIIYVDDGGKAALLNKNSLLSVGVTQVSGNFISGEVITVMDSSGGEIARGKTGINSKQLEKQKGQHFEREVIHRDNIVIL